jgi:branched-chain amino acid transport system permease protein
VSELAGLLANGISTGALYGLVALGIVVVYKASSVVNFALPSLLMLGTYVVASASGTYSLPFWAAIVVGVAVTALVAVVVELVLVRQFTRTNAIVAASIMTIGLDIVISTEIERRLGPRIMTTGDPWQDASASVAGLHISQVRLAALLTSVVLLVAFSLWLQRSDFGIAMRAVAERPQTAALMGVRLSVVAAVAWAVAGVLATVAGVFLVGFPSPGLEAGIEAVALRALPAAIIGSLSSTTGAVVGGLIVGVTEVLALGYHDKLAFLGDGLESVAPYVVMLAVLLWRPAGLFGKQELRRV